jgi:hypothetical protein
MRSIHLLSLVVVAACSTGPSKQDSVRVFAATMSAASAAQSAAVSDARTHAAAAPGALAITFDGACPGGGTMHVDGNYDGSGTDDRATFDMNMAFAQCRDALGDVVDGNLHWNATASGDTDFSETMTGDIAVDGGGTSTDCGIDMTLALSATQVSYAGTMCGYDVQTLVTVPR